MLFLSFGTMLTIPSTCIIETASSRSTWSSNTETGCITEDIVLRCFQIARPQKIQQLALTNKIIWFNHYVAFLRTQWLNALTQNCIPSPIVRSRDTSHQHRAPYLYLRYRHENLVIFTTPLHFYTTFMDSRRPFRHFVVDLTVIIPDLSISNEELLQRTTKQPPAKAGGFELRTKSPDTRRLNDTSYSDSILKLSFASHPKMPSPALLQVGKFLKQIAWCSSFYSSHDLTRRHLRRTTHQYMHMILLTTPCTILISNASHVWRTSSRTRSAISPFRILYRYFVTHTKWYSIY